jgi:hypothetical protein
MSPIVKDDANGLDKVVLKTPKVRHERACICNAHARTRTLNTQRTSQHHHLKPPKKGASAEVYLHGAHVTAFRTASGRDVMFVSKEAVFKPPKAIRGGVPVCFPQFGALGPLGQHGFARNTAFELVEADATSATLVRAECVWGGRGREGAGWLRLFSQWGVRETSTNNIHHIPFASPTLPAAAQGDRQRGRALPARV